MLDAWGKPTPGILTGHIRWLGDYDECINISVSINSTRPQPYDKIRGKYCTAGLSLSGPALVAVPVSFQLGVCMPSGCADSDVLSLFRSLSDQINSNLTQQVGVQCLENDVPLSVGATACLVVYGMFALVCVLATAYDFLFMRSTNHTPVEPRSVSHSTAVNGHITENADDTELLVPNAAVKQTYKPGPFGELLMCFSFYTNGYKLLSAHHSPDSLACLHGIRFISLSWVILGHTLVFSFANIGNFMSVAGWIKDFGFQAIVNATVSVDSFFALSGLLSTYLLLKGFDKAKKTVVGFLSSVPVIYLHRYIRLTPAYGFMIFFYTYVSIYMMEGPLKPDSDVTDPNCLNNSWSNFLYINNLYDRAHQCSGWGWYLANDFQFSLAAPFVAYLLYRSPVAGVILNLAMIIASCGAATGVSVMYDLGMSLFGARDPAHPAADLLLHQMDDYYFAPWVRFQSYGVGIFAGFILYRLKKDNLRIPQALNVVLWLLSATLCLLVVYGPYDVAKGGHIATVAEAATYNGWGRTAWAIGLCYVIIACVMNRGGWVNEFLSWPGFIPLSRMTYCAYLVHPVIITVITYSERAVTDWTYWTLTYKFASYMTLSYAVAFLFSLMFESPFMLLDKKFLTGKLK